jgi:beta-glucosidase
MLHGIEGVPTECPPSHPAFPRCAYTGNVVPNARLGIPPLTMNDGPQGFRDPHGLSTQFPSGLAAAASWDVAAMRQWGAAMGQEFHAKGANVQLGPGLCVARVPNNGRLFEYSSGEDPFLGATLAPPAVAGIQSQGVIATMKHFVDNSQESSRTTVEEHMDERTQREVYYPPFESAGQIAGAAMCAYNKVRVGAGAVEGAWSCENAETLGALKRELGFNGWVMSDWGATHSTSLPQGLDMEMPGADFLGNDKVTQAMVNGSVTQAMVDDAVLRVLTPMFAMGLMDAPNGTFDAAKRMVNVTNASSAAAARSIAAGAAVLLKNDRGVLPLLTGSTMQQPAAAGAKIAVVGLATADNAITGGSGSGSVVPSFLLAPLDAIRMRAGAGATVTYTNGTDLAAASAAAAAADVAIVFVGTSSGEGTDRPNLSLTAGKLPNQDALVAAVAAAQQSTVVVISSPGPVLAPWSGDSGVAAILASFMPGQEFAHAITAVLFGDTNPSGKLPVTFPNVENETALAASQWPGTTIPPPQGFCTNGTFVARDLGCVNTSNGGWPSFTDNIRPNPRAGNMTWAYAAQRCNAAGYPYAAVDGGDGAGIHCAAELPPLASLLPEGGSTYNVPMGNNLCNKTSCSGDSSESCGGDGYGYNGTVRPTRALSYTCERSKHPGIHTGGNTRAEYSEGLLVGYRYYDAHKISFTTGFPFGHGLSYTTWGYANLEITPASVSFKLSNTGRVDGAEVAQLYLGFPTAAGEPPKQLKGFVKQPLAAGASAEVLFELTERDFSIWSTEAHAWEPVPGLFQVFVGSSSRDLRLTGEISR